MDDGVANFTVVFICMFPFVSSDFAKGTGSSMPTVAMGAAKNQLTLVVVAVGMILRDNAAD